MCYIFTSFSRLEVAQERPDLQDHSLLRRFEPTASRRDDCARIPSLGRRHAVELSQGKQRDVNAILTFRTWSHWKHLSSFFSLQARFLICP